MKRALTCSIPTCLCKARLGLVALLLSSSAAAATGPVVADGGAGSAGRWTADLWLTQEYRYRTAGSATVNSDSPLGGAPAPHPIADQDLRLTLDGSVVGMRERAVGTLSAALWFDLDGHAPRGEPDLFGDAQGFVQPLTVLYAVTAEWRRSRPLERLALGRQQALHGLPVTFDGGAIDVRFWERRLSCFGYGGRTVHFFQAEAGFFENWLAGGGVGLRLSEHLQVEADSRYLHETILDQGAVPGPRVDTNSYGVTMTGRWDDLQGKLFARGMNRSFSHLGGVVHVQVPAAGLGVDGQATVQLVPLGEIAESEAPFYSMLGNSLPHLRARLETWKDFRLGERGSLALALGTRLRQLLRDQPTRFNRNMNLLYLRGDLNDLGRKGVFASLTAEWNLPAQAGDGTSFLTVGGAAGYTSRKARAEAGTYYQRFKINYYRDVEELQHARTVYALAGYRVLSRVELRGRYVVEVVDRTIHAAYLTLREDF